MVLDREMLRKRSDEHNAAFAAGFHCQAQQTDNLIQRMRALTRELDRLVCEQF